MPQRPLTTIGDAAVFLTHSALYEHQSAMPVLLGSGRVFRTTTALGTYDVRNARAQAYFFRIVSILEAFTDAALEHMFRNILPTSSEAAIRLLESHLLDATQRWETRKKSFAEHHSLPLSDAAVGFPRWSQLDGMIEVRNSVAHGLGSLTRQQRQNPRRAAARCSQVGVQVWAGELLIDRTSLEKAAEVAEEFIRWLDAKL